MVPISDEEVPEKKMPNGRKGWAPPAIKLEQDFQIFYRRI
jgi:hypothetical protein